MRRRPHPRVAGCLLVAVALQAGGSAENPHAQASHPASAAAPPKGRTSDAEIAELAKGALQATEPAAIHPVLVRLRSHVFKSSRAPERELTLYAQGILEARLGNLAGAAVSLKKLERQWPKSPFMGEGHTLLAEYALSQRRLPEAESRLHKALAWDMPSERKRRPQELLIWVLAEQGRHREALPIIQSLRPLEGKARPSEEGLAGIVAVYCATGDQTQAKGALKDFEQLYPQSALGPQVQLAWGQLLGRTGASAEAAQVFRKLITSFPKTRQADDARLALASLLTDGTLSDTSGLPSADELLSEVRRGGKGLPKGTAQVVELRLLVGKSLWEDALNLVDRMDLALREGEPEVRRLWTQAWNAWVGERVEKGFPGELLTRLQPTSYRALDREARMAVAQLLASKGLLEVLPGLLGGLPAKDQGELRRVALAKTPPETQPQAVLELLPARGGSPEDHLLRARARVALGRWAEAGGDLGRAKGGRERIEILLRVLQRPLGDRETARQRLSEAEGWLRRAPESASQREPLDILVADLRFQAGDVRGALVLYPVQAVDPGQRGWVGLMRAQALLRLGQREQARAQLLAVRDEAGFKAQRDALAHSLGAY